MPIPGLSLVGFMDPTFAVPYLQVQCVPADASESAVRAEWKSAHDKLGPPIERAGNPEILEIPPEHSDYLAKVRGLWALIAQEKWEFKLIEIDTLLAFQHQISLSRSDSHCGTNQGVPSLQELLCVCLPDTTSQSHAPPFFSAQGQSMIIRVEELNVRLTKQGVLDPKGVFGIEVGVGVPLVNVARFNGRCYLRNGFHRTYGMRKRGATHVPCIFRETDDPVFLGLRDGATFGRALMECGNPPTLGHFTQDRAYPVALRKLSRVIQINWSEHSLPDE